MVDDEGRIVMRLEQARAYRDISVAELARRVGVDRVVKDAPPAPPEAGRALALTTPDGA